jgi:hypothetical protein
VRTTADRNCQTKRSTSWTPFSAANTKREEAVSATVGPSTSEDRIEVLQEVLGMIDQLLDKKRVGMVGDRNVEPIARPELEDADGG